MSELRSPGELAESGLIVGAFLFYAAFILFPVFQGQWSWVTHGRCNLFVTGIFLAIIASSVWHAYGKTRKAFLLSLALFLTALAFICIFIPAFVLTA